MSSRLRLSATRLARQLRQQSSTGLTPSQLSALAAVGRHGALTLGDLADQERVAPPTITKIVGKLEAAGLLERRPDPDDRRFCRVVVTPEGSALLDDTRQRRDAWLALRLADLDPDQQARLAGALDVLEALIEVEP